MPQHTFKTNDSFKKLTVTTQGFQQGGIEDHIIRDGTTCHQSPTQGIHLLVFHPNKDLTSVSSTACQ